ncbi:MAG: hypothetical protein AB1646_21635 [Thermodesulfobacteriota bacterium]
MRMTLFLAILGLIGVFALVEYRSRNPEWKPYQLDGVAIAVERLEAALAESQTEARRDELRSQIDSLKGRAPAVTEIRPFGGKRPVERCLTCHYGIEDTSASHPNAVFGCVVCHGGNGADLTVSGAHRSLRGGRNPASLDLASRSCGATLPGIASCHSGREHPLLNRTEHVPRSLMATNAGIISTLRFQWGVEPDTHAVFGIKEVSDGKTRLKAVPSEHGPDGRIDLASSHFRKFCAGCHLWVPRFGDAMGGLAGCAACHAPYRDDGRYRGGDPTVKRNEPGHAASHSISNRIPDDRCRACHNRSARVGLNFHGEMESEQYGTPFAKGGLNDRTLSDDRFVHRLVPDIHHEKGLGCIDCHTGQDTMGDGTLHGHAADQIEIRCEDCHGSHAVPPGILKVNRYDPLVQALVRTNPHLKVSEGDEIPVTSKGRPLPHIRRTVKGFVLTGKLDGREHPVTVITGKLGAHSIRGHERLECDSCHSAWSPQCYGCHQMLDMRRQGSDQITGKTSPGRWVEGRSLFRFERHIYGLNARGKVGILVPG